MKIKLKSINGYGAEFEEFYDSLGLDRKLWHKEQTFDLTQLESFTVFGLPIDLKQDESFQVDEWVCSLREENDITIFWINECAVAARMDDPSAIKDLPSTLRLLSINQIYEERCLLEEDMRGIAELRELKVLALKSCSLRADLRELSRLKNLVHLVLDSCDPGISFLDVSHVQQITNLDVTDCDSLDGLSGLNQNHRLRALQFSGCDSVKSVQWLSGLGQLEFLDLHRCGSLTNLSGLNGLDCLVALNLSQCDALMELRSLPKLKKLKKLDLSRCQTLTDLDGVQRLVQLNELNLENCRSLINIYDLAELPELKVLQLSWCKFLSEPGIYAGSLAKMSQLHVLEVDGCKKIQALEGLEKLVGLEVLSLRECQCVNETNLARLIGGLTELKWLSLRHTQIENLNALSELKSLTKLNLSKCISLNNLEGISDLANLEWLDLAGPNKVTDFTAISDKKNLKYLDLDRCSIGQGYFLSKLAGLENLKLNSSDVVLLGKDHFCSLQNLKILELSWCVNLRNLDGLSELISLEELDLSRCALVSDLSSISGLPSLKKLDIENLYRIRSLESLRDLPRLRELNSTFHPGVVSEVLAHAAVLRSDKADICLMCEDWFNEVLHFTEAERSEQERFAATLGEAFSLLGEHDIVPRYEFFLDNHPEFSATPWKAWLQSCAKHQGYEFLVQRVERVAVASLSPGAVGGICASLPSDGAPPAHQDWAREWLEQMESSWQMRAKELLPVSAEVCLAHERLGMKEALRRWLDRFTDPSDPAALDPVQAALGRWQLHHGQIEAATEHAMSVQQPAMRDPLFASIVEASYRKADSRAGELLMRIESDALRGELAVKLVQEADFARSALNMERLIVACGPSVETLARLIEQAHSEADRAHLQTLSEKLRSRRAITLESADISTRQD